MKLCLLLLALLIVVACGGSSPGTTPTPTLLPVPGDEAIWAGLESRPLALPVVGSGECPVAAMHSVNPEFAPALGDGPLYPVGFDLSSIDSVLGVASFPVGGDWLGAKVLWVGSPDFRGRAIVRGGRLDAPGQIGFGANLVPDAELRLDATDIADDGVTWLNNPSYTRVQAFGCYAYQVDTDEGSYTLVFRAERAQG